MSSIEHRRTPTGTETWRVRFRHHGRQRSMTFATRAQAASWAAVLDAHGPDRAVALLETEAPAAGRTVTDQVHHHIEHLTGVTDGTRRRYEQTARLHLSGRLAVTQLEHLTRDDVAAWVNAQTGSPKSIRNRHGLLSAALESAVRDDLIPKNVAKGIRLPRVDGSREEMVFLEPWEFEEIAALLDPAWTPLARFLVGTGARWGEATAVRVGDIDARAGTVRIARSWKETGGAGWELGPPKTVRGRRTAKIIPASMVHIEPLLHGRDPDEWLFLSKRGGPVRGDWWRTDVWRPAVARSGIGKAPRVHDLRHTFASWAIRAGVPLTVLQRQLGHESIQTTSDTYGHLAPSDFDAMGSAMHAWAAASPPQQPVSPPAPPAIAAAPDADDEAAP